MPPSPLTLHPATSIPPKSKGRNKNAFKSSQHKPFFLAPKNQNTLTYTQTDLKAAEQVREQRYQDLLACARKDDRSAVIIFPGQNRFEIPMKRVVNKISVKLELVEIYQYLQRRWEQGTLPTKITKGNFGQLIGCHIPRSTMAGLLNNLGDLRKASEIFPDDACYMVKSKNSELEQVLVEWIKEQRDLHVPVTGRAIKKAASVTFLVLTDADDLEDEARSEVMPSFSASWFDKFKKRNRISYVQLHGEEGSVNLEAIEPELVEIRALCSTYPLDDIYNCDETGLYLKELDTKTYTVAPTLKGAKATRASRVTILFCINATGTSLAMADKMDTLKPFVLGKL
jgi:hypothetical protein